MNKRQFRDSLQKKQYQDWFDSLTDNDYPELERQLTNGFQPKDGRTKAQMAVQITYYRRKEPLFAITLKELFPTVIQSEDITKFDFSVKSPSGKGLLIDYKYMEAPAFQVWVKQGFAEEIMKNKQAVVVCEIAKTNFYHVITQNDIIKSPLCEHLIHKGSTKPIGVYWCNTLISYSKSEMLVYLSIIEGGIE